MSYARHRREVPRVSLVPLVDVFLILLIFFMVTSTFLDLDMLPLVQEADGTVPGAAGEIDTLLVRLTPDGDLVVSGQVHAAPQVAAVLAERSGGGVRLLILPSPQAATQSLVTVLDAAAALAFADVSVVRFGAQE